MNFHTNRADNTSARGQTETSQNLTAAPDVTSTSDDKLSLRKKTNANVIRCDGQVAVIGAISARGMAMREDFWAVGQLISIEVGTSRIVGLIFKVDAPGNKWIADSDNQINVHIELVGEITLNSEGKSNFSSGISNYPYLGASAHRIRSADLAAIYENNEDTTVTIGTITQDASIPALITVDKLLSRHFAVVGTTGVGKSTSVALILRKIVAERPDIRTLILDPHNEFATAFPKHAITVDAASLDLPFWMFTMEEFIEVIYRGRPGIGPEIDALRDLIPQAKQCYETGGSNDKPTLVTKRATGTTSFTADTPVPYRMPDLLKLIDEKIGLLEGKSERPYLKSLKNRIESIINDPRFKFMFDGKSSADAMNRVLSHVFRIPQNDKPICVFELSGIPSEVVNVVASVMCRLAFDLGLSSQGAIQTLVVCEEAHRYIPANTEAGFAPTRAAIARIAKEGRKYGVYLGVITQRPGELDPTILSQCNTIFSMRLGNESDQEIVRQAITGAARSTASFLSSLANRECIAFGEAIDSPMRMMFETVAKEDLPGSHIYDNQAKIRDGSVTVSLASVVKTMRKQNTVNSPDEDAHSDAFDGSGAQPAGEQKPSIDTGKNPVSNPQGNSPLTPNQQQNLLADEYGLPAQVAVDPYALASAQTSSQTSSPATPVQKPSQVAPKQAETGQTRNATNLIRNFRGS